MIRKYDNTQKQSEGKYTQTFPIDDKALLADNIMV